MDSLWAVDRKESDSVTSSTNRVFAENLVGLGFLYSVSYIKSIPAHEKIFAVGKSCPISTLNLIFLGLGCAWVGEFVGFRIIFTCFPHKQNLVNRKNPNTSKYYAGRSYAIARG